MCVYVCVGAPGCSPAGIPGQSFQSSAGQSGPERPAAPGSDGRCGSSGRPSAAAVSLAVDVKWLLLILLPMTAPAKPLSTVGLCHGFDFANRTSSSYSGN